MLKTPTPVQVQEWIKELNNPNTPVSLRRNYEKMLRDLHETIGEVLDQFGIVAREEYRAPKRGKIRAFRS